MGTGTKKEVVLTIITILRGDRAVLQYGNSIIPIPIAISVTIYPFPQIRFHSRYHEISVCRTVRVSVCVTRTRNGMVFP
jgi:hypothetical protein